MKKGHIITNAFYTNPSIEHQVSRLTEELEKLGVSVSKNKTDEIFSYVDGEDCACRLGGDFAVYLDKDPHISAMLEKCGMRLFNTAAAVAVCDDKMATHIFLSGRGVRMPRTVSSPLSYYGADSQNFLTRVERLLPYPIVVKKTFGSMGQGVFLAEDRAQLAELRASLIAVPHIYQQFIGSGGRDKRVAVVGGKAVAAMERVNSLDFRSNLALGGTASPAGLTEEERALAEKAAAAIGLDYCGVDIISDGTRPYVCEVNSNAFFLGIEKCTGVPVAALYAKRIYDEVYGNARGGVSAAVKE